MTGLALALVAAYGVYLLYTALVLRWSGYGLGPRFRSASRRPAPVQDFMVQAGLADVRPIELAAVCAIFASVGVALGFALFGGPQVALLVGGVAMAVPFVAVRVRRDKRREEAREAWPRLIEEIRLQATTMGRSVPNAVLAVGSAGPEELRPAFEAAHREWLISTDFPRTLSVLKSRLADPTADMVCETLLVAHEVGGADLEARLTALAEDRAMDLQGRKDARAKQAGARFARLFVLIVPVGMAFAGMSIGDGRAAYATPTGQIGVLVGFALMGLCWAWAGRIMRLPAEDRVFDT